MDEQLIPNNNNNSESRDNSRGDLSTTTTKKFFMIIVATYVLFSLITSISFAFLPPGQGWRLFSWHPLLMVLGVIGMMGAAVSTKKLGGYKNTKLHAIMTSSGLLMAYGGLIAIYRNKDIAGKNHFTSVHSIFGLVTLAGFTLSMCAGLLYLHPDFGIDNRDDKKRLVHKWFGRTMILLAWITCFLGLQHLTSSMSNSIIILIVFAVPLVMLAPITLL